MSLKIRVKMAAAMLPLKIKSRKMLALSASRVAKMPSPLENDSVKMT